MRKIFPTFFGAFLAVLVTTTHGTQAGYYSNTALLGKVEAVEVVIEDSVTDLCLPRPNSLRNEAEYILKRMGIQVLKDARYKLQITPAGFELKEGGGEPSGFCVASLEISLWSVQHLLEGDAAVVPAANTVSTHVGAKETFQDQLRKTVNYVVTYITNDILEARTKASFQPK